uniref:Activin types I and II receptor domain-containing protein n=1 Tax=Oryzias latipes TaxID=8090 RepID=A0A3P9GXF4_ORYLA
MVPQTFPDVSFLHPPGIKSVINLLGLCFRVLTDGDCLLSLRSDPGSKMPSPALTACVCILLLPTVRGLRSEDREDRLCAFSHYPHRVESASTNGLARGVKENGTIHCSRGSSCYGLWEKRADGEMLLLKQGCWTFVGNQQECHDDGCFLATAISSQMQKAIYHFCCCNQDLCNTDYTKAPPTTTSPGLKPIKRDHGNQTDHQFTSKESTLITVGTVATATIVLVALLLGYRMMKRNQKNHPSAAGVMGAANTEATMDVDGLKLLDVEKNLREMSDDYLTEFKLFDSQLQATNCERLQSTEVTSLETTMKSQQGSTGSTDSCLFSTNHPHQTLPQRPTSLHLPPNKKSPAASCRPKLGKLKFLHEQVETGVATMNTVSEVSVMAGPHLVTTVTNNAIMRSSSVNGKGGNSVCRSTGESVPTLVANSVIGRGRINPAGPQDKEEEEEEEEEVKLEIGMQGEESHPILLNGGPEEHEPLLRSEQLPAERELHPLPQNQAGNISTGMASNSNNNNNRPASQMDPGGRVGVLPAESEHAAKTLTGCPASVSQREREVLCSGLKSQVFYNGTLTVQVPLTVSNKADRSGKGPHQKTAENGSALDLTRRDQLLRSAVVIRSCDPKNQLGVSEKALEKNVPAALKAQLSQEQDPPSKASHPDAQTPSSLKPPVLEDPSTYREASPLTPETAISASLDKGSKLQHEDLPFPTGQPKAPDLMQFQVQHSKARRRPCSLQLSSSCSSSGYVSMSSDGSLSATGEKIKRRVKTPYTLKKWCTTSWVVSADTSPSSDFECNTRARGSCQDASGDRRGGVGIHKMNPFKSSTTAFVVGGGDIATKTSEQERSHF